IGNAGAVEIDCQNNEINGRYALGITGETNVVLKNCRIVGENNGIRFESEYNSSLTCQNSSISVDVRGIDFFNAQNKTVSNCNIISQNSEAIFMHGGSNNTINNCSIAGESFGVYLEDTSNNALENNPQIIAEQEDAIYIENSSLITISGNNITVNHYLGGNGVILKNSNNCVIGPDNEISGSSAGVSIDPASSGNRIEYNTIEERRRSGVNLWGPENYIEHNYETSTISVDTEEGATNYIRYNDSIKTYKDEMVGPWGWGAINVSGKGTAVIEENTLIQGKWAGIITSLYTTSPTIIRNNGTIKATGDNDTHMGYAIYVGEDSEGVIVEGNDLINGSDYCVYVLGNETEIRNNNMSSDWFGVLIDQLTEDNQIVGNTINTGARGIKVDWAINTLVQGNTVCGGSSSIISEGQFEQNPLSGNNICDTCIEDYYGIEENFICPCENTCS
ncbi:MAG: right-handed parallel beta-helix repeat-containing protein, partial [Candidatus Diapherotrites archaeon]|nr:right-handed parallel beta-helix repeat-containing protein [Candidatus Diapherotrites archaeon]